MAEAGLVGTTDIPLSLSPHLGPGSCWCLPGLASSLVLFLAVWEESRRMWAAK